jgi:general secretion pathway protein G
MRRGGIALHDGTWGEGASHPPGDATPTRPQRLRGRRGARQAGFTLLELMIVVSIIATISSIAVPLYSSAVHDARVKKAKQELRVLSRAIDIFKVKNKVLPTTLADVDFGGRRDPWGHPYLYLNFESGTGNGMTYAVDNGLVDPEVLNPVQDMALPGDPPPDDTVPQAAIDQVKRKDKFLFPLNTDYDLFSLGPNGVTRPSLGETFSLDDVIRANDGGYFGLAADY